MRAAQELLVAEREEDVLAAGTRLLGTGYGYRARYIVLREGDTDQLRMGRAEGPGCERPEVTDFRTTIGKGLTGTAADLKRVVNVPDVSSDARYLGLIPGARSKICVPLMARGNVLGVLALESDETFAFSEQDEEILTAYAQLLAGALMHVRVDAARKRDIAELQAVNLVAEKATRFDLQATLDVAIDAFQKVTTSDSTAVYMWDPIRADLRSAALVYDPQYYPADYRERMQPVKLGEGMVGWSALNRQPAWIDDTGKDPRPRALPGVPLESKSAIVVPLIVEAKLYGVIRAVKMGAGSYNADHFRLAQTIASQVALAIAAVESHREQAARLEELSVLHDVSTRLAEVATLNDVLESVLEGALRITGGEAGVIWRRQEDGKFVLAATRNMHSSRIDPAVPNQPTSLSYEMLRTEKPVCIDDLEAIGLRTSWDPEAEHHRSMIGLPVRSEGEMLGSLFILHQAVAYFNDDHVRRVQVIASHAGAALSRARSFEEAQRLSITDELTGFFNARYLQARLGEEVLRAQRYGHEMSIVMIDSDALKKVNDKLGHEAGNKHLIELAKTIRQYVRSTDIVARYGGDEFIVLQPEAGVDAARATAERIRVAAASQSGDLATSVSIGVASFPANARDAHALFRAVDGALLEAKNKGKNAVVVAR